MRRQNRHALTALILQVLAVQTHAATYVVNSIADPSSGNATNCVTGNVNTCTLRDSLASATNGDAINFNADMTISLVSGHTLTLSKNATINGDGHAVIIDGNNAATVLTVSSGVTTTISHLTIRNGYSQVTSGGINNYGTLTVASSTLSGNRSTYGGGVYNKGSLTLVNSSVAGNNAGGGCGGGICNMFGTVTLTSSTVAGNLGFWGGAISNNEGTLTLTNSTLSGNTARGSGGAIRNWVGTATLTNSTISGNTSGLAGSGIYNVGTATFANTIIADGCVVTGLQSSGTQIDNGGNLDSGTSCGFSAASSKTNVTLDLGTLQSNGGPTKTMMPGAGSAALEAGLDTVCAAAPVEGMDQRGVARPQGAHCDAGAVERRPIEDYIFNNSFDF